MRRRGLASAEFFDLDRCLVSSDSSGRSWGSSDAASRAYGFGSAGHGCAGVHGAFVGDHCYGDGPPAGTKTQFPTAALIALLGVLNKHCVAAENTQIAVLAGNLFDPIISRHNACPKTKKVPMPDGPDRVAERRGNRRAPPAVKSRRKHG
jgi:hypothetical protein